MESATIKSAVNQLRQLVGREKIVSQLEKYLTKLKDGTEHNTVSGLNPCMVFMGNPGTGKTIVARLFGEILYENGLLSQNLFVKTTPSELISCYIGATRAQSRAVFDKAKGGALFIDEAYSLHNDFGKEAVEELMQFVTNNSDSLVILAGYPEEMKDFLNSNLSILRRFSNIFVFEDYTNDELVGIFRKELEAEQLIITEDALNYAEKYFSSISRDKSFGNALEAKKLFDQVLNNQSRRIQENGLSSDVDLRSILPQDFPNYEIDFEGDVEEKEADCQIETLHQSLSDIREVIDNIQFNVAMLVQNQASAADVAVLQRENEAFRSDSNMKLMRRYGIDALIKTYQAICDRMFRINHSQTRDETKDTELNTLSWVLKRIERQFKPLGIKLKTSQPGSAIDESVMVVYGSNGEDVDDAETLIETEDANLKGTVKESICPAFVWTIPSLIGDAREWCMEAEKICIYK